LFSVYAALCSSSSVLASITWSSANKIVFIIKSDYSNAIILQSSWTRTKCPGYCWLSSHPKLKTSLVWRLPRHGWKPSLPHFITTRLPVGFLFQPEANHQDSNQGIVQLVSRTWPKLEFFSTLTRPRPHILVSVLTICCDENTFMRQSLNDIWFILTLFNDVEWISGYFHIGRMLSVIMNGQFMLGFLLFFKGRLVKLHWAALFWEAD
jgi:hypothetical protein